MSTSVSHGKVEIKLWFADLPEGERYPLIDVGCGAGWYGKQLGSANGSGLKIGIEAYHPYIERFALASIYDRVVCIDICDYSFSESGVVIFGNVLHYLRRSDAIRVVASALSHSYWVLVSIPLGDQPEAVLSQNPFEARRERWLHHDMMAVLPNTQRIDHHSDDSPTGVYVARGTRHGLS